MAVTGCSAKALTLGASFTEELKIDCRARGLQDVVSVRFKNLLTPQNIINQASTE